MWIRMTLGIGILTLPNYVKEYGLVTGLVLIVCSAYINYLTYDFIFTASYETGKQTYPSLIKELLGDTVHKIFRVTYMADIASTVVVYCISSWNMLTFLLWNFNIWNDETYFEDLKTLKVDESHATVIKWRVIFFSLVVVCTIPLFLKKRLDDLQPVTIGYLSFLLILVVWLMVELPFIK